MFGFLAPRKRIPEYRRSYARVCQYQRKLFGITSLPFLSFEAAFLYQVAADLKLIPALPVDAMECCRLRRLKKSDSGEDQVVGSYAAAFGVMLAGIKLQDDVVDSGRWFNHLARWKYGRQVRCANETLASFAPSLPQQVADVLAEHAALEKNGNPGISEYAAPTGRGFAAVFSSLAGCIQAATDHPQNDQQVETTAAILSEIGQCVGRAIIAWDCAVDFDRDRIKGDYNPLRTEADVRGSLDYSVLQLAKIGWRLPEDCASGQLIADVSDRIHAYSRTPPKQHPVRRWERWGLIRERGYSYARCDGCEAFCAVGECCECGSGAAEATTCCAESGSTGCCLADCFEAICCCRPVPCCGSECQSSEKKKPADKAASNSGICQVTGPYAQYIEKLGTTSGDLNPAGFVVFAGEKIPAKTATGKYVSSGTEVRVTQTDAYGVTVIVSESQGNS